MQDLWELYKPQGSQMEQREPEPKTNNQFLLFLNEQDGEVEVIEDEYAYYYAQLVIKGLYDPRD